MTEVETLTLRVGAWYGDSAVELEVPARWDIEMLSPSTPPPLGEGEIRAVVENPTGAAPLRIAARGKKRPLIIVDDLTRPTPTDAVIPHVLRELEIAGIDRRDVTILVGCGMHGRTPADAAVKKAGAAGASCRLLVHDPRGDTATLGRTSFGTPVIVNGEVAASDLVVGIGGVYPQHSVGFGGGSKLLLGVLGQRSIVGLHYGHPSVAGSYDVNNDFRRDLDEMAHVAGLRFMVLLHVDAARHPVRAVAGDPRVLYMEAARFSLDRYAAEAAGARHDVVIANAYPMDSSLTFARSKGLAPLAQVGAGTSRVFVAACPEGLGLHGLFPYLNGPRFESTVHRLRRWSVVRPSTVPARALGKARRAVRRLTAPRSVEPAIHLDHPRQQYAGQISSRGPVHLWAPMAPAGSLPRLIPGLDRAESWAQIVERVELEHPGHDPLRVAVYPCAPLQCLVHAAEREAEVAAAC
ncbi:MAG TPA: lactate racemase domain-containing protein [Candidatus Dormibacteraeota bacterium]|nr:lactate racemase domain-containing protein [Candidatus Dormibacteraeota bacterium]